MPSSALNREKPHRTLRWKGFDPVNMVIDSCPSIISHIGSASMIKIPAASSKLRGKCRSIDARSLVSLVFSKSDSLNIELESHITIGLSYDWRVVDGNNFV